MGIYYRYAAAVLILLFCADTYSATRKTVNHNQSKESVIKGSGSSFQTPSGDAAFYGQDYVDTHQAKSLLTTGPVRSQKINVKPTVTIDPKKAAKSMIGGLRGGVPGVVASAAAAAIIDAIDGVIEDSVVKVPSYSTAPQSSVPGHYFITRSNSTTRAQTASESCRLFSQANSQPDYYISGMTCNIRPNSNYGYSPHPIARFGSCSSGYKDLGLLGCGMYDGLSSPSESDWLTAEQWAAARNSDFVRDMVKASCEGSSAPARCYDEMSEWGNLQGPSSQIGPAEVTTTTTKKPDGTTSTTTSTVQNRYEYNFGPNYYNYSTTTKTTTNTDGLVTDTETSDGLPTDEPTQEDDSVDYTFNDTEFPEVPSFYVQKYPDGLQGVWQQARADVDQSAFMQFLQGFVPSFSGSCPAFGLGFNIASWASYGNIQFSSICYVLNFVKIILLVTALFTFRKVTFGG